jgi:hypothetical protein
MRVIFALVVSFIVGCAAVGVPATSDPFEKVNQAWQLMYEGRPFPSERLALNALSEFEKESNFLGIAKANSFLGIFYSSSAYRSGKDLYIKQGTYDSGISKSLSHLEAAKEAWIEINDLWGASTMQLAMGDSYISQGNKSKACAMYKESLNTYNREDAVFAGRVHTYNTQYGDYPDLLNALISRSCV